MNYLIVDDDSRFRQIVCDVILRDGDKVLELSDGADVVSAYTEFSPDWVIMDIKMKEVDGLVATRDLKSKYPSSKVLILTNYCDKWFRRKAVEVGASAFLPKENLHEALDIIRVE